MRKNVLLVTIVSIGLLLLFLIDRFEKKPAEEALSSPTPRPLTEGSRAEPNHQPLTQTRPIQTFLPTKAQLRAAETFQINDAFCKIEASHSGIPTGGKVRVMGFAYGSDDEGEGGFIAYVHSTECPAGLFSKIRISSRGQIKDVIDCRTTTKEKLYVASAIQGNIDDQEPEDGKIPMAISGAGFFVVRCGDSIQLKRSGNFAFVDGELKLGGCVALSRTGDTLQFSGPPELDDKGCTERGECIAVADPSSLQVAILDRESFSLKNGFPHAGIIEPKIFMGALENLKDPDSGAMGPNWKKQKPIVVPVCR